MIIQMTDDIKESCAMTPLASAGVVEGKGGDVVGVGGGGGGGSSSSGTNSNN